MRALDWMGREIIVSCDFTKVWERITQETGGRDFDVFSFDAWKRQLKIRIGDDLIVVDISDLIT